MPEYRDISNANIEVDLTRRGQVYQATHRGELRLSLMNRSFISFTYGGKHIEDFNLIATINNDRIERDGYASFNDTTTTYDNLDGQYYWGTHYKTNQLNFTLSTDGIDQPKLDEFLYWFHAGETRELILAEHPNRAILARVAEPPQISLLPFEDNVEIVINNVTYPTKTTLYKGDINLTLVMDEPHWYAIQNILGRKVISNGTTRYIDYWKAPTDPDQDQYYTSIFASQDALKILYEDGIPLGSMIDDNMLLGNEVYANIETDNKSKIWSIAQDSQIVWTNGVPNGEGARINGTVTQAMKDADTAGKIKSKVGTYYGTIAGAIMSADGKGISSLSADVPAYFYYSGTAPAYTTIEFDMTPVISDYVSTPHNSFIKDGSGNPYNTIIVTSQHKQIMKLTTPNILTSYNKAISVFQTMINNGTYTWEDVRANIRDTVRHQGARDWATKVVDCAKKVSNTELANSQLEAMCTAMSYFLKSKASEFPVLSMHFKFNSQYGEAIGEVQYRYSDAAAPTAWANWASYGTIKKVEEDVGDMLNSNYLIIKERNYPNENGKIVRWADSLKGRSYSHKIVHNFESPLSNFIIQYKNMYL